ncbi:solute carrier family 22 member 13-like [Anabas testudineus]|uniref:solute carrier family 22 member 13-like n=1 Tax=Anabas testudineus TaxID=64144 RepID=UPI000E45BB9E|nr:solute carrier family 22 member 13-like [Anabas testudineus]
MADFGEILRSIGEFGLFQQLILFALCFPNVFQSFVMASFLFIQSDPERHCNTDWILRTDPNLTTDEQLNLTLPREEDGTFSKCRMFVPVDWNISDIREYGLNETTLCQNGWEYYNTMYTATIVTDFDLVCDKASWVEMIQAVFVAGALVGSLLLGPFAESFGRKRAIQISAVISPIFIVTTAFCPNVYLYLASQFMVGFGSGAYLVNSIILCTEWIGPSKRSWGACLTQLCAAIGQCIVAGVIYAVRNWRLAQLITAAPSVVALLYIWFIPESARWLLSRGRTEEAKQLIVKVAAVNKCTVPDSLLEKIVVKDVKNKGGIKVILRSSVLIKYFLIMTLAWFSLNLSMLGLYFNIENIGLNIFLTQLLFGAIEIPAHVLCIWLLEVLGRKILLTTTLLSGGLFSMLILAVPGGYGMGATSLAVVARFFLTSASSVCNVFIQELFPTSVRQTATALGALLGRSGALVAPLLNILAMYHWVIPITIFGSITIVGGALSFLLPETRRTELPDSTEEAVNKRNGTSTHTPSRPDLKTTKL